MESYHEWLASGAYQYTEARYMKSASRHLVVEWILEPAWKEPYHQVIQKLWIELREDHLINCFKEGQPCDNGLDMLKETTKSPIKCRTSQQQSL